MAVKNTVYAIPMTSINSNTFDGSYKLINASGLPHSCTYLVIANDADVNITVSYDGVTDHDFVGLDTARVINPQLNAQPNSYHACFAKGTKVWVKGVAGNGNVYVIGYYQPDLN